MLALIVLGSVLLVATLSLIFQPDIRKAVQDRKAKNVAGVFEEALHRFYGEYKHYPLDLQELVHAGILEALPDNPYGSGEIQLLKIGMRWKSGAIMYVPVASLDKPLWITSPEDLGQPWRSDEYRAILPDLGEAERAALRKDWISEYVLFILGPSGDCEIRNKRMAFRKKFPGVDFPAYYQEPLAQSGVERLIPYSLNDVPWDHVTVLEYTQSTNFHGYSSNHVALDFEP